MAAPREEACLRFELPEDREGDIAVVASARAQPSAPMPATTTFRSSRASGCVHMAGFAEQVVPFILSPAEGRTG